MYNNRNKRNQDIFIDNIFINKYASGDLVMVRSLELIKDILIREKCKDRKILFKDELAINLDKVETEYKKGTSCNDNTIDFVVGLKNNKLLLVEAKFSANNMENVAKTLSKKTKHSKELLTSNQYFIGFYGKVLILLSNNEKFHQNKRKLMSLLLNDTLNYYPLTIDEFYSVFFKP